jgi:hypothetical protein
MPAYQKKERSELKPYNKVDSTPFIDADKIRDLNGQYKKRKKFQDDNDLSQLSISDLDPE